MATIEEIQARRTARKADLAKQREAQYALDLEALDSLEAEHGDSSVATYEIAPEAFRPGLPTLVVVRVSESAFNRYRTMLRKAKGSGEAIGAASDMLADVCVAYPEAEVYKAMRKAFEGLHDNVAVAAAKLAEGKRVDEGKG